MARRATSSGGKSGVELPSVYSKEDIEKIAARLELSDSSLGTIRPSTTPRLSHSDDCYLIARRNSDSSP